MCSTSSSQPEASPLDVRAMERTDEDTARFLACFAKNGMPRDPRGFRWQFLDNPTGKLFVDFAVARDGSLGAIYAVLPVTMRVEGRRVLGLQSVDTLTDADHRGKGLFVKLAQRNYARAQADGAGIVYGFPNGQSAHGFFTRLGWQPLDPVPFLARPLRTGALTRRLGDPWKRMPSVPVPVIRFPLREGQELRPILRFDDEHTALWHSFARDVGVAVDRDATYLNWRLIEKPAEDYRITGLYERGRLLGFGAYCFKHKHDTRLGYLMELVFEPSRPDVGRTIAAHMLSELQRRGCELVLAWSFPHSPNHRTLQRTGFLPFPERMRPVELHVGARRLATPAGISLDRPRWYVSYCDSDTV